VTLVFQRDSRLFVNTFHVDNAAGWDLTSMGNLATAFHTWYTSYYKVLLPTYVALSLIEIRKLDPAAPLAVDVPVSPPEAGTRTTSGVVPADATATISWRSGLAGRAYRGRDYVPGITLGDITGTDLIASALQVLMSTAAAQLINAMAASFWKLGIFHRPLLTPKPLDNTITQITSYVISNLIDSQRDRLAARGT
jgi:hypothetical protein